MRTWSTALLCLTLTILNSRADDLDAILGSPTNEWRIGHYQGATNDYTLAELDRVKALSAGPNAIVLTGLKPIAGDSEVTYRVRLAPSAGKSATIYFLAGLKDADDAGNNPLFLQLHIPAGVEQESVACQMPPLPGEASGVYILYLARNLPKGRTTWPEMVRARVEAEMEPVAPLAKRWLTVRYVFRKNSVQTWLDGRLLREAKELGIGAGGHIRLHVYEGAHLASVRIRSLPAEDSRFEQVQMDGYLNAAGKVGQASRLSAIGPEGKDRQDARPTLVGGIPFAMPAPDERGHDHVDVGRSWMRFGLLEGGFDGWEGETARWRNALTVEPNRLKFRIPNGQYTKMHLLASYDGTPDTTDILSAQFYRADSGFPVTFSTRVNGKKPHLVTIPLEPEGLASLSDLDHLEFELTKEVRTHRSFPDPIYYSAHGAGLPSGVRVYAITFERPSVEVELTPDKFAHIWTAPESPSYTVMLQNRGEQNRDVEFELATISHDGTHKTTQKRRVNVPASGSTKVSLPLSLRRYGHHDVKLTVKDSQGTRAQTRSLAFLHPDTRERNHHTRARVRRVNDRRRARPAD